MPMKEGPVPSVLLVDDDVTVIQVLSKTLSSIARLRFATRGEDALRLARESPPDLVLLDAEMPGMSGFEVWIAMRDDPALKDVPAIFVTGYGGDDTEEEGLALGAADFIAKPIRPAILLARVRTQLRLKKALDELRAMATTDPLTGCANRRTLDKALRSEWARTLRPVRALSILMLDIDHFKRYNDSYGHLQGDQALVSVAQAVRECALRPGDLVARYGGEEFVVVLPESDRAGAMAVSASILDKVLSLEVPHIGSDLGKLSVSIGVASFDANCKGWELLADAGAQSRQRLQELTIEHLLGVADRALYAAKQGGRARNSFAAIEC